MSTNLFEETILKEKTPKTFSAPHACFNGSIPYQKANALD